MTIAQLEHMLCRIVEGEMNRIDLEFEEGWNEILSALDAADYQRQLSDLVALTQQNVRAKWARDRKVVEQRWKQLIERIAYLAISEDDLREMTPSEIVETALVTLTTNLDSIGWEEEGKSFRIPDLALGEDGQGEVLDITKL